MSKLSDMPLPAGWAWARLGELGEWYGGGTPSKSRPDFWEDGQIPWLSPKDMGPDVISATQDRITQSAVEESSVRVVPAKSVAIVTRSGILERVAPIAFVPFETTLNQDMKAVCVHSGVSPRWLAWCLRSLERVILKQCRKAGTTVASLSTGTLMDLHLAVPPLAEQHRIVEALEAHLSRLDAASQSLTHAQSLIPLQRRALYTAATEGRLDVGVDDFVPDFLEQRREHWQSTQSKKYKEPVFPDPDHVPQLPANWRVHSLEALTDPIRIIRYGILMPKVKSGGTVPYAEVKDLKDCTLHGKELHLTSTDLDEQFSGARIQPGDILVAVRGSYDRSAIVPPDLQGANISRDVARISPLPGIVPEYLQLYLQSSFTQHYLKAHARGVAVKGVNIASIRALPVAVPPPAVQKRIVESAQQQLTAIEAAAKAVDLSIARSSALRRALLDRAFTGRLVTQDLTDEPASVLFDRIRAEREAQSGGTKGKVKRAPRRPRKTATADGPPPPPPPATPIPAPTTAVQQEFPL